ncbi:MAG: maltodextrin glycosyltransferase, partial [Pseudothermotoga sp.]|nr:maltodextrin glycosyltransferase [Pseudothermotoga sp.]
LIDFFAELTTVRKKLLNVLLEGQYRPVYLSWQDGSIANASYWKDEVGVIALANLKLSECSVNVLLDQTLGDGIEVTEVQSWDGSCWKEEGNSKVIGCNLSPLGFKLYVLKFRQVKNR